MGGPDNKRQEYKHIPAVLAGPRITLRSQAGPCTLCMGHSTLQAHTHPLFHALVLCVLAWLLYLGSAALCLCVPGMTLCSYEEVAQYVPGGPVAPMCGVFPTWCIIFGFRQEEPHFRSSKIPVSSL